MGFNSVFRSLQEIFPQVDVRLLKAVAIEQSKDTDAAVEVILSEVIPFIGKQPEASPPTNDNRDDHHISGCSPLNTPNTPSEHQDFQYPSVGGIGIEQNFLLKHPGAGNGATSSSPSTPGSVAIENPNENCRTHSPCNYSTCLDEPLDVSSASNINDGVDTDQRCLNIESREDISSAGNQEMVSSVLLQSSLAASSCTTHEDTVMSDSCSDALHATMQDLIQQVDYDSCASAHSNGLQSFLENASKVEATPASSLHDSSAVNEKLADFVEHASGSRGLLENSVCDSEMNIQDNTSCTTIVTRSGQICRIDLLEDAIEDAKSNKQTLFSAMETVINMMKKVELQEKEVESAKEEANRGGLDILAKVEEHRQMLQHAKDANDMHAGEVYGEKAILATEMRELQSRLVNLSEERDKSLAVLDEMRLSLEGRLAAAEEIRTAAEKEKQEKEESAQKALVEQELIMDKVVQESKRLQLEAEENTKLRDFLIDRGRVVDTLQGEIAVICQDVKLLKEKFDDHLPLSKSLSSSQTSCVLASSTSFYKGLVSDWVSEQGKSCAQTPKRISPASSVSDHSQNNSPVKKDIKDDRNVLSDDEWDLFEDETQLHS